MKNKNLLIAFVGFALIFAGCSDLDTLPQGDTVTSSQKEDAYELYPERAEAGVNAIFAQFNQYMPNERALNASRHNDIGYPSIMLFTDTNGEDVISDDNGYNWMGGNLSFADRSATSRETQIIWNDFYSMIYTANSVAGSIEATTDDPTNQFYLGQGLAARAFSYFGLIQLYQFNYKGNESKPGVPIITDENANEVALVGGAPRSSVQEVYDLILSDLNKAVDLIKSAQEAGVTRKDKRYVDLAVAYGIRARVHLTMQNWTEAAKDASNAIAATTATPAGMTDINKPAFWDSNAEKNFMWAIIIAETDRVVTSGIVNWLSHMGSLNYGYANFSGGKQINKKLFNSISETDVRKGWWIDADGKSENLNADQQFMITDYGYDPYTQVKFAPYKNEIESSTNASDIPLMRIEEMHLIKAEAEAMSGAGGASTLESFVKGFRDPDYTFSSGSKEVVQEEVFRQRRIELWGEGLNWYDLMRLNKGVDRRGAGYHNAARIYNIPSGSPLLLWRIPEAEIQANPKMSETDNNPAAPAPSPVSDN